MSKKDFDFVLSKEAPPTKQDYKVIVLKANPVPLELPWHQLTGWKRILEVKAYSPKTYDRWIREKKIPYYVLRELGEV